MHRRQPSRNGLLSRYLRSRPPAAAGLLAAALLATAMFTMPPAPAAAVRAPELPPLVFHPVGPGSHEAAADCARVWQRRGPDLVAALVPAGTFLDTVSVLLLPTAEFRRHFGTRMPDWGVGVAVHPGRVIALDPTRLPAVGRGVEEVFLHEMVHALLMQAVGDAWLPTWLHEGAAMWLSGEWQFTDTVAVILSGRLPSLEALSVPFPRGVAAAGTAYRTSLLAMGRLRRWYGDDVLTHLLAATATTGDFEVAFQEVTGEELDVFHARFAQAMELSYGWVLMLFRWPTLFVLMALLFAVGAVRRLVLARRRLAEMADEEWPGGS
ncbi:MAG: hypothetical protein R6X25_09330 [Candidatus Krumholzibacteriia bacterium]